MNYNRDQFYYRGPSMNPTLRFPDLLYVLPYNEKRKIRCGDVIVFPSPCLNRNITPRVVSIDMQGIRTRGDNNVSIDDFVTAPSDVIGRVVYARKKN